MYSPMLKGLHDVHAYTCERLESLLFDRSVADRHDSAAAYLHGKISTLFGAYLLTTSCTGRATAMSTSTAETVAITVDNLLSLSFD